MARARLAGLAAALIVVAALSFSAGRAGVGVQTETATVTRLVASTTTVTVPAAGTHETVTVTVTRTAIFTKTLLAGGSIRTACFSPGGGCAGLVSSLVGSANRSVLAAVYLVTNDEIAEALARAASRGVEVKLLVEEREACIRGSDLELLASRGVEVRVDSNPALMHDKFAVIDGRIVVTGSMNWSWSGDERNNENTVVIVSESLARAYAEEFWRMWAEAKPFAGCG